MLLTFLDETLVCQDCGKEFIWSAGEQEFYAVMGFDNPPKRCPHCRKLRRARNRRSPRQYPAVCAACGKETLVPFVPADGRPVYCDECYKSMSHGADVA